MSSSASALIQDAQAVMLRYAERFPERAERLQPLFELIKTGADVTSRKEFRGHITCGVALVNSEGKILVIHHNVLNKYLLPGGHLEQIDTTLVAAAKRELLEETGVSADKISVATPFDGLPFFIDCHAIPANPKKNEDAHFHWDFKFVYKLKGDAKIDLQQEEVSAFTWVRPEEFSEGYIGKALAQTLLNI